jgi:hypothetical protein
LNDKVRRSKQHTCVEKTAFDTFGKELASKFEPVEWHPKLSHFEENLHPNLSHPNRRSY